MGEGLRLTGLFLLFQRNFPTSLAAHYCVRHLVRKLSYTAPFLSVSVGLFQCNLATYGLYLLLPIFCLFFLHAFLEHRRCALHEVLRLFEPEC